MRTRFGVLSLASLALVTSIGSNAIAATDLLHEWKLDEVTGTTATDAIGAIGGGIGGLSSWTSGKINNGFTTTGSTLGYVNAGNVPISGSFSLSFWVKPENASLDWRNIVSKHDGAAGTRSMFVGQSLNDGALRFSLYFDGTNPFSIDTPANTVANNQWAFVTATWNETTKVQSLYVNGTLAASATQAGQSFAISRTSNLLFNTNSTNPVAGLGTGSWARFPGTVDDVAIWNSSLTPSQIKAMASTTSIVGLNTFDAQSFDQLVNAYETNFPSQIGNTRWTRATGLNLGAGNTQTYSNGYAMQLDAAGVGVTSLSTISLSFDPQYANLADTTNATDNPGASGADEPAIHIASNEIDGLTTNSSIGSADIRPGTMNGDIFVMLWLADTQGTDDRATLRNELIGTGGSTYTLLDATDPKWQQLALTFAGFDTLVRFDDATLAGAVNWDFATHTDIVVDRIAVSAVPEPTTATISASALVASLCRRRRNSQLTTHNSQRNLKQPTLKFSN